MPLTHNFKETIRARVQRDASFREALLQEAAEMIANGDLTTGNAVLRDYVSPKGAVQPSRRNPHS